MTAELVPIGDDHALIKWAEGARAAHGIAQSLAKTVFVSTTLRGKPDEITAAILAGFEIGLQPLSALRSIDVIQGTPALRAVALRGLVQAAGHDVWVEKQTGTEAVVCGKRRGSDHVQKSVWTIERAGRLGLATKDNWRSQPEAMLVARATSEVCRMIASDVLLGLPYSAEELEDQPNDDTPPVRRTARRKPLAAVEDTPPPAIEEPAEPEEEEPQATLVEVAAPELEPPA